MKTRFTFGNSLITTPVTSIRRRRVDIRVFVGWIWKLCEVMIEISSCPRVTKPPSKVQMFAGNEVAFGVEKLNVMSSA